MADPIHDTLNALLRGEISAIETYQQAMAKINGSGQAADLRGIHDEHIDAANILRKHIHGYGGQPEKSSGAWGSFAKAVEGTAAVFGATAALKALKEGEEQGIADYESALNDENLPADCKRLIESTLLPQTRAHIPVLENMMAR